ncbi:hypothetical protein HQ585_07240 [candidate division KSB1 bacterium]|nr:hypothetical protein [candidate division KSB1 bacterium]
MKKQLYHLFAWSVVIAALMMLTVPASVYSADLAGTWKAEFDTQIGIQKYIFTFAQTETGITGIASSDIGGEKQEVKLIDIKVDSNKVSFVEMLVFQEMELEISYHGILSENEMKLVRDVGDVASEDLIAKRVVAEQKE